MAKRKTSFYQVKLKGEPKHKNNYVKIKSFFVEGLVEAENEEQAKQLAIESQESGIKRTIEANSYVKSIELKVFRIKKLKVDFIWGTDKKQEA